VLCGPPLMLGTGILVKAGAGVDRHPRHNQAVADGTISLKARSL